MALVKRFQVIREELQGNETPIVVTEFVHQYDAQTWLNLKQPSKPGYRFFIRPSTMYVPDPVARQGVSNPWDRPQAEALAEEQAVPAQEVGLAL